MPPSTAVVPDALSRRPLVSRRRQAASGSALLIFLVLFCSGVLPAQSRGALTLHLSVGQTTAKREPFHVRLIAEGGVALQGESTWQGSAGAGHADTKTFDLTYPKTEVRQNQGVHVIWADLFAHSDADTAARLSNDPAARIDPRRIRVELNAAGTRGFTLTVDQIIRNPVFWIPSLDLFITTGAKPVSFAEYRAAPAPERDGRVLDQVQRDPEASYEQFKQRWENMGNPAYTHPVQEGPGHIVGLTWDSAIPKFGIDRGAGVWNDYGNSDHFRFWFGFGDLADGIIPYWRGQTLTQGLPVITTVFVRDNVRYEVEQFAYPLDGPPKERTGDLKMILLQRVRLTDQSGAARTIPVTLIHERLLPPQRSTDVGGEYQDGILVLREEARHQTILAVKAKDAKMEWVGVHEGGQKSKRIDITVSVDLPAHGMREFDVLLPSPMVDEQDTATLKALDYDKARTDTLNFWSAYLARGASFHVPEQAVNDLFHANLWHALRLPRRHSGTEMDLPYSNFAYDQTGTPWPINQAVYVDYMLYGLRGYNAIATEEMAAIFRNNQEVSGRVDGFAHWHAYTPGLLYSVAQNYLLSGDRESFGQLLPASLHALDWSIAQIRAASTTLGPSSGLVAGALNDITGRGFWAFNQAYLYAGIERMGRALAKYGDPRAAECRQVAAEFRTSIERAFEEATVRSPLVQLRDHTWVPFVPSDADHAGRNYEQWYPSDVDTGVAYLIRLEALPAQGALADAILNDHEDNLFLHQWGLANEPIYSQQAMAYLLRDDPKAVIRTFYSLMAGGFSQDVYEPVEHRWRWGQYFGPPSTDGAWFEIYRNMLVREWDDDTLIVGQATPRAWLQDNQTITVSNAPTAFGKVSFELKSHTATGHIEASLSLNGSDHDKTVLIRLRHPQHLPIRSVLLNGQSWSDFDNEKEWIRLPKSLGAKTFQIDASY